MAFNRFSHQFNAQPFARSPNSRILFLRFFNSTLVGFGFRSCLLGSSYFFLCFWMELALKLLKWKKVFVFRLLDITIEKIKEHQDQKQTQMGKLPRTVSFLALSPSLSTPCQLDFFMGVMYTNTRIHIYSLGLFLPAKLSPSLVHVFFFIYIFACFLVVYPTNSIEG